MSTYIFFQQRIEANLYTSFWINVQNFFYLFIYLHEKMLLQATVKCQFDKKKTFMECWSVVTHYVIFVNLPKVNNLLMTVIRSK